MKKRTGIFTIDFTNTLCYFALFAFCCARPAEPIPARRGHQTNQHKERRMVAGVGLVGIGLAGRWLARVGERWNPECFSAGSEEPVVSEETAGFFSRPVIAA